MSAASEPRIMDWRPRWWLWLAVWHAYREAATLRAQRRQTERHLADLRAEVSRAEAHIVALDGAISLNERDAVRSIKATW